MVNDETKHIDLFFGNSKSSYHLSPTCYGSGSPGVPIFDSIATVDSCHPLPKLSNKHFGPG